MAELQQLCAAVLAHDDNSDASSGAAAAALQERLCAALLATLTSRQQGQGTQQDAAEAWQAAGPALSAMYRWPDEQVVQGVISFWRAAASALCWEDDASAAAAAAGGDYAAWLHTCLTARGAAAVVERVWEFKRATRVSSLHTIQTPPHLPTLLLVHLELQLHDTSVRQLLELMGHATAASSACTLGAVLGAAEAFTAVCTLLQAVAPHAGASELQELAARAGAFLQHAFGWVDFSSSASAASPAAAASMAAAARARAGAPHSWRDGSASTGHVQRLPGGISTLYDCMMMQLLAGIQSGPPGLQPEAGSRWRGSAANAALSALVATYDRPQELVRGLHARMAQQQEAQDAASAPQQADEAPPDQGSRPGAASSNKAAAQRLMDVLDAVFLASAPQQQPDDVRISALLAGLSELLRPAANCSVETRVAALHLMGSAITSRADAGPSSGGAPLLWSEASCEGLLFCLLHDPSIQARRRAAGLLQHVVLPRNSPAASALVACLARKLADKDGVVAKTVLQLFVQLGADTVCRCLTANQWCAAVQAALSGVQQPGTPDAVARQLVALLTDVVRQAGDADDDQAGGGRAMTTQLQHGAGGVRACRQVLCLLMSEPSLEAAWRHLAAHCPAAAPA